MNGRQPWISSVTLLFYVYVVNNFVYLFFLFSVQLVLWHVSQRLMVGRRHGFDFSWLIYGVFNHVHLYLHINPAQKASQMFLVDVYILWHGLLTKSLIPLESLFISLYICKENEKLAKFFLPMSRVLFCYWLLVWASGTPCVDNHVPYWCLIISTCEHGL